MSLKLTSFLQEERFMISVTLTKMQLSLQWSYSLEQSPSGTKNGQFPSFSVSDSHTEQICKPTSVVDVVDEGPTGILILLHSRFMLQAIAQGVETLSVKCIGNFLDTHHCITCFPFPPPPPYQC